MYSGPVQSCACLTMQAPVWTKSAQARSRRGRRCDSTPPVRPGAWAFSFGDVCTGQHSARPRWGRPRDLAKPCPQDRGFEARRRKSVAYPAHAGRLPTGRGGRPKRRGARPSPRAPHRRSVCDPRGSMAGRTLPGSVGPRGRRACGRPPAPGSHRRAGAGRRRHRAGRRGSFVCGSWVWGSWQNLESNELSGNEQVLENGVAHGPAPVGPEPLGSEPCGDRGWRDGQPGSMSIV